MTAEQSNANPAHSRFHPRPFLMREWPYLLILLFGLFGVAYTSISQTPMRGYWIALTPFIGLVCIIIRWRDAADRDERLHLVWTQCLHWVAVLLSMQLLFIADVARMMNSDASALSVLTLLGLGTFLAGVHIGSWRICLVGVILGAGVPEIAWLEQSALFLLLVVVVLVGIVAPIIWHSTHNFWHHTPRAKP
ncbi:hypothetical protein [Blastochloris viridis]|uniref:Uncharacterized protein n=2 Tax=Blastochloris viridis TaxID=1079 RepID=A0A0P0JLF3_BLAVI|nr:hypothetical protein [Blastochloris viridis]ALK10082.1 hypothetical protein BVIR_2315 [Blastochloris viridis]CUU42746.1 hypothetical protein BVIRIDIS_17610 [Blastochloris viridis]